MNPGNRQGNMTHHHSMGNEAVLKTSENAGTKVGSKRVSTLSTIPNSSHLFVSGLKVNAE